MSSVIKRGFASVPEVKEGGGGSRPTDRFWLKKDEVAVVCILDGSGHKPDGQVIESGGPAQIYEHQVAPGGSWKDSFYATCIHGCQAEDCPGCKHDSGLKEGKTRYYVGYYTVIDERAFTTKDGREFKFNKRLLGIKQKQLKIFEAMDKKRRGLAGTIWEVTRTDSDAPRTGNVWDFVGYVGAKGPQAERPTDKVDPVLAYYGKLVFDAECAARKAGKTLRAPKDLDEKGIKDWLAKTYLKPFDYERELAPKTVAEFQALIAGEAPATGDEPAVEDGAGDDIPFDHPLRN